MRVIISSLLLLIMMTGCATKTEIKEVRVVKKIKLIPPKKLINDDIALPEPPNKEKYIKSGPITRENMLTFYIIDLLSVIKEYKLKLKSINNWYKETNTTSR